MRSALLLSNRCLCQQLGLSRRPSGTRSQFGLFEDYCWTLKVVQWWTIHIESPSGRAVVDCGHVSREARKARTTQCQNWPILTRPETERVIITGLGPPATC